METFLRTRIEKRFIKDRIHIHICLQYLFTKQSNQLSMYAFTKYYDCSAGRESAGNKERNDVYVYIIIVYKYSQEVNLEGKIGKKCAAQQTIVMSD